MDFIKKCIIFVKQIKKETFIIKADIKHNNFYDYSFVEYKNNKTKVKIICPKHGIFEQRPNDHLNGQGCTVCKKEKLSLLKKFTKDEIILKANNIHNNLYNYNLIEKYNGYDDKIKIICSKHGVFEQTPHNHLNGQGCPMCKIDKLAEINSLSKEVFLNKSNIIHNNFYDYSLVNYNGNKNKVKIICPTHGVFKQRPNAHLFGCGCPKCNTSKGEKKILNYLNENSISFIYQKRFDECKYKNVLSFDFYLPSYNICIEYDGKQHYEPINFFGGKTGLKNTQIRDKIKNNFCEKNDIIFIRISYKDFKNIEIILNNKLKIRKL